LAPGGEAEYAAEGVHAHRSQALAELAAAVHIRQWPQTRSTDRVTARNGADRPPTAEADRRSAWLQNAAPRYGRAGRANPRPGLSHRHRYIRLRICRRARHTQSRPNAHQDLPPPRAQEG